MTIAAISLTTLSDFNVATGDISANHPKKEEEEVSWEPYQDQPAVLPRCTTVYILCRQSPWCVPVENRTGVTVKVRRSAYKWLTRDSNINGRMYSLLYSRFTRMNTSQRMNGTLYHPKRKTKSRD
jgi:hypothetical protein